MAGSPSLIESAGCLLKNSESSPIDVRKRDTVSMSSMLAVGLLFDLGIEKNVLAVDAVHVNTFPTALTVAAAFVRLWTCRDLAHKAHDTKTTRNLLESFCSNSM